MQSDLANFITQAIKHRFCDLNYLEWLDIEPIKQTVFKRHVYNRQWGFFII